MTESLWGCCPVMGPRTPHQQQARTLKPVSHSVLKLLSLISYSSSPKLITFEY